MAMTAPQDRSPAGVPSIANSFSQAAAAAAASMASIFPHQILFHHGSCKVAATVPPLIPLNAIDASQSQFEAEEIYGYLDETPPQLVHSRPVKTIGAGLANLGNTCFLNSVLQCLTYTPPLAVHLQSGLHSSSCKATGFCAMCALERHVREALSSNGRTVSPNYLAKNLRCISRSFQMWRQEDAHEYMRYLIEALQKCCSLEVFGGKSLIRSVFGGRLRSQVKCTQCSHCSNKYDPFLDLSLEVARADSLQKALAHFTAIEVLDGDNKYHCSKCKTKVRALKQFTIDKAPPILTVQLKRFSSSGGHGGKIDKKVHFESILDLKPFVNGGEDEEIKYSLYAVLVHSGWSIHSGHYYCFVRTGMDTWHAMDDSQVSQVSERTVLEQKAYILFYVRNTNSIANQNSNHPHKSSEEDINISQVNTDSISREEISEESHEKLLSKSNLEINEGSCLIAQSEISKSLDRVEEADAAMLNVLSERSWYRAVQIINSSCSDVNITVDTQSMELVCLRRVNDVSDDTQMCVKSICTGDTCKDDVTSCSEDDKRPDDDSDKSPILESNTKQSRCLVFNVAAPIIKTSLFESAGQHAFSILCMCAKFCFWSCFWSPL